MRNAEAIHCVVFTYFVILAWVRALPGARRWKVTWMGIAGIIVTLAGLPMGSIMRDWIPAALVLVVYWQAGAFFTGPDLRLQKRLLRIDEVSIAGMQNWLSRSLAGRCTAVYLETAYLLCYPMIPMSLGALYAVGRRHDSDAFWTVVLIATYLSYGALPFLQTLPPRVLSEPWLQPIHANPVRRFNLWILRNASIHANTLPSAHVAASSAAALVMISVAPLWVGLLWLVLAAGIAVGTFAGRYHYATDAVSGCAVAVLVFAAVRLAGVL